MPLGKGVITTDQAAVDPDLRPITVGFHLLEGDVEAAEHAQGAGRPGAVLLDGDGHTASRTVLLLRWRDLEEAHEHVGSFENDTAVFEVSAPDLAIAIGKAQMQMNTRWGKSALEGDDLELSGKGGGTSLSRAGKRGGLQIPHHAEHETVRDFLPGNLFETAAYIGTGVEMNRQNAHQAVALSCSEGPH